MNGSEPITAEHIVAAVLAHALIGRLGREPDVTTERNQDRRPSRESSLISPQGAFDFRTQLSHPPSPELLTHSFY